MRSPEDSPTFSTTMSSPSLSSGSVKSQRLFSHQAIEQKGSLRLSQRISEQHDGSGDFNFTEFKVPPPPPAFKSDATPQHAKNKGTPKCKQEPNNNIFEIKKPQKVSESQIPIARSPRSKSTEAVKMKKSLQVTAENKASAEEKRLIEVDPEVGKLYNLGRRVGKGAYGIVWEAKEKSSGRQVALKKIFEAFRNSTDSQRTYREIIFLKAFGHHPNIISLIGGHKAANKMDLYLVFPYMKFDLYKVIEHHSIMLTEANIRYITYQLTIAINYLHSAEIIHRDLKPANILLDDNLHVELADLGLSRTLPISENSYNNCDGEPSLTDYVATRWYRPPEIIISCRMYDKSMDMWAFGCILGEVLLKKVLFAGNSANHQLELIMQSIYLPSDAEIQQMCASVDGKNVGLIKTASKKRGPTIPEIFEDFDFATVDIIERLLCFTPDKRLNVEEVLAHPFFFRVRQPSQEYKTESPFIPPLSDDIKLKIPDYQKAIYDMIDNNEVTTKYDYPDYLKEDETDESEYLHNLCLRNTKSLPTKDKEGRNDRKDTLDWIEEDLMIDSNEVTLKNDYLKDDESEYLHNLCLRNTKSFPTKDKDGRNDRKNILPRIEEDLCANQENKERFNVGMTFSSNNPNYAKVSKSAVGMRFKPNSFLPIEKNGKFDELFSSKASITERIRQIETKVKGRVSLSHDAIHNHSSLLRPGSTYKKDYYNSNGVADLGNERLGNNVNRRNGDVATPTVRQKLPTEYSKTKFSFNPYSQVEYVDPVPQPQRPFGGRSYGKVYHGPTFKKSQSSIQSLSDTEITTANYAYKYNNSQYIQDKEQQQRPLERKSSAYFPHKSRQQRQLHTIVNPFMENKEGVKLNPSRRRIDLPMTKEQLRYPSLSTTTFMRDLDFNPPESVTIRASELLQLRNSLRNTISTKESKYL